MLKGLEEGPGTQPRATAADNPLFVGALAGGLALLAGIALAVAGPLPALALLIAATAGFVVLRWVELGLWGMIGVIYLLPYATLPVDVGITPTLLDVVLAAVVGVWGLALVTGRRESVLLDSTVTPPLLLFILVTTFAFVLGLRHAALTPSLLRKFAELLLSLSFVIVIVDYCRDWARLERLVQVLMLAGGAAALAGIVLWVTPDELANRLLNLLQPLGYPGGFVIRYIEENPALAERAIGTSVDPNSFGGLLVLAGALAGPQLVSRRPLFSRIVTAVVVGLIFVALILTFSRGAMLGLATGLGFVALIRYRRLLPYMAFAALALLLLPATQGYIARFIAGFRGQDLATQMRFGEYTDALTLISRYPLFGAGFGAAPDIDLYLGVANIYLTIGQQMGLLGLVAFLALMVVLFGNAFLRRGVRHWFRDHPRADAVWLGLHAAVVGALAVGVFDHYFFNIQFHHMVTIFWLLFGMAAAATRLGREGVS